MKQSLILTWVTLSMFIVGNLSAQEKMNKVTQSIKVDKEVTIDLNTSYCNIVFDTWNKNTVEVEAYIEGDNLSKEELQDALKSWNVNVEASNNLIAITSKGNTPSAWAYKYKEGDENSLNAVLRELKFELADLPEPHFDFNFEMPEIPEIPEIPEMPELPELPEGIANSHFDYDAYKKDGEAYMKQWSENFESKYGKDYAKKMEAWGEKFGREWNEKYGQEMAKWGEKFGKEWEEKYGKRMEEWSESFAKQMEEKAKRFEQINKRSEEILMKREEARQKQGEVRENQREEILKHREKLYNERAKLADERRVEIEKMVNNKVNTKVKKTIKIKMPKNTKLKVNVRHGELEFASNIDNLKADLSYTKFTANSINGSQTSINASYSQFFVTHWKSGNLNLNYVKNAEINNADKLMLTSNASNIFIKNLMNSAIINGSIGDLKILKIDDAFTNLNMTIENCNAVIALPKVDHNLVYKGNKSKFSHPKKNNKETIFNFTTGDLTSSKNIVVNAKYSSVVMQ
ncbi:hypothetical protein [Yeosuana sp. AK3]